MINPIIGTSVASIINKHADYAAVGRPVINTQNSDEYRNLIVSYNMGYNCRSGDFLGMANCINQLEADSQQRISMGKNARRCAEEKFDRNYTYTQIAKVI